MFVFESLTFSLSCLVLWLILFFGIRRLECLGLSIEEVLLRWRMLLLSLSPLCCVCVELFCLVLWLPCDCFWVVLVILLLWSCACSAIAVSSLVWSGLGPRIYLSCLCLIFISSRVYTIHLPCRILPRLVFVVSVQLCVALSCILSYLLFLFLLIWSATNYV